MVGKVKIRATVVLLSFILFLPGLDDCQHMTNDRLKKKKKISIQSLVCLPRARSGKNKKDITL